MTLFTMAETGHAAAKAFRTFSDGMPELVKTGLPAVDREVGGLGKGAAMILAAGTGIGKSSVMLAACLEAARQGTRVGCVSLEDTPDVLGCRLLARYSGVDSRKIRKKDFDPEELEKLVKGQEYLQEAAESPFSPLMAYCVGGSLFQAQEAIKELTDAGCEMVYVDYLQKIRGHHEDRRNEVSRAFTGLQAAAVQGDAALCVISQVKRLYEPGKLPKRSDLKESGDLENEARIIVMIGKGEGNNVIGVIDKSTFGGEGTFMQWTRGPCGTLFPAAYEESEW